MGLGRFFKGLIDNETMGENIIEANVKTYNSLKTMNPSCDTFSWLCATYLSRKRALGQSATEFDAQYICSKLDKLPEPLNARALGLTMLMNERMDIFSEYPKFAEELEIYMDRVET